MIDAASWTIPDPVFDAVAQASFIMTLGMFHDILRCVISPVAHSAHELQLVIAVVLVFGLEMVQHVLLEVVQDLVATQLAVDSHQIFRENTIARVEGSCFTPVFFDLMFQKRIRICESSVFFATI